MPISMKIVYAIIFMTPLLVFLFLVLGLPILELTKSPLAESEEQGQ